MILDGAGKRRAERWRAAVVPKSTSSRIHRYLLHIPAVRPGSSSAASPLLGFETDTVVTLMVGLEGARPIAHPIG